MRSLQFDAPIGRRTGEPILAVLVLLLTARWFGVVPLPAADWMAAIDGHLLLLVLGPGVLALSVLGGVVAHGYRVAVAIVGSESDDRTRARDIAPVRIAVSIVFGILAGVTVWLIGGTLVALLVVETGGVLLSLAFGLISASVLAALVLLRAAVRRLRPERSPPHRLASVAE